MGILSSYQQDTQEAKAKLREKIKEELSLKTVSELSYILGRYCGPSNQFLSEKKFGYHMPSDIVEELIGNKSFEDEFLNCLEEEIATSE